MYCTKWFTSNFDTAGEVTAASINAAEPCEGAGTIASIPRRI
jgi:hypothetical protein